MGTFCECAGIFMLHVFFLGVFFFFFHVETETPDDYAQFCFLSLHCIFMARESEEEGFPRRPCSNVLYIFPAYYLVGEHNNE